MPDAELLITSDFSLWGWAPGTEDYRRQLAGISGISFLAKVSRPELVCLQRSAKVMAYPCTYPEGFCLAALECLAAGAVPVTTNDFALITTVGDSGVLLDGQPGQPAYDEAFVEQTVRLLRDESARIGLAAQGRRRVFEQFGWGAIADRFEAVVAATRPRAERDPPVPLVATPPAKMSAPTVAVAIPVHNRFPLLLRALWSVVWQVQPQDEIIVVNDASTDWDDAGIPEFLRRRVLWLTHKTPRGPCACRNEAIRHSRAEWIGLLEVDEVLAPFALNSVRRPPVALADHVQVLSGSRLRVGMNGNGKPSAPADSPLSLTSMPVAFVRRQAWLEMGLFDEASNVDGGHPWSRLREHYGDNAFACVSHPLSYRTNGPEIPRPPQSLDGLHEFLAQGDQGWLAAHGMDEGRVDRQLRLGEVIDEPPRLAVRQPVLEAARPVRGPEIQGLAQRMCMGVAAEHVHRVGQQRLVIERKPLRLAELPELKGQPIDRVDRIPVHDEKPAVDIEDVPAPHPGLAHQFDKPPVRAVPPVAAAVFRRGQIPF